MKKITLIIACSLSCVFSQAQTIERFVISSGGAYLEQGLHTLSYTVAQPATETVTTVNNILTQGFQQPEDFPVGVSEIKSENASIYLFPNPASDNIHVSIKSESAQGFTLQVIDIMGKSVMPEMIIFPGTDNMISLSGLARGSYIIRVTTEKDTQAIKFLKN